MKIQTDKGCIVMSSLENENKRLTELHSLSILDTKPEENFDRITRHVARIFDVPICLISLISEDRQWFKSCVGTTLNETEREAAFCQYVVAEQRTVVVEDTLEDPRFCQNRLVSEMGIRFYAGARLLTKEGNILGTLCIIDTKPRELSSKELVILEELASWVISEIELRQEMNKRQEQREAIEKQIEWAGRLQAQLLPVDFESQHALFKSLYIPSEVVSGDFYHYKWVGKDKLFGYIVDVMGHGIPTALQTSAIRVLFSQALETENSLGDLMSKVNEFGLLFMPEKIYFTSFGFMFDFTKQTLKYSSAGINHFYHKVSGSAPVHHKVPGAMMGMFPDLSYKERQLTFKKGDVFIFCTDGFSDVVQERPVWDGNESNLIQLFRASQNTFHQLSVKDDTTALFIEIR
ncbi:GAF domain-containing SpoIIE family protein phosphatase [Rossellomorea aquimaris]|nr:SpoIIE family protein phosphatase [Rossellomorea vietnamensis]